MSRMHVTSVNYGRSPTVDEYMKMYNEKIEPVEGEISEPVRF